MTSKALLLRKATRQLKETGVIDCLLYMDLNNAGINPEALTERILNDHE